MAGRLQRRARLFSHGRHPEPVVSGSFVYADGWMLSPDFLVFLLALGIGWAALIVLRKLYAKLWPFSAESFWDRRGWVHVAWSLAVPILLHCALLVLIAFLGAILQPFGHELSPWVLAPLYALTFGAGAWALWDYPEARQRKITAMIIYLVIYPAALSYLYLSLIRHVAQDLGNLEGGAPIPAQSPIQGSPGTR